jgi:hypothetical protein
MELNYDSVKTVLIRGKWYNNNVSPWRASITLVADECGVQRMYAKNFISDHLVRHEPFVFLEHCNQVFLIPNRMHLHWQLVVDTNVQGRKSIIPIPLQEGTSSGEAFRSTEENQGWDGPSVKSDSEGEIQENTVPSTLGENS